MKRLTYILALLLGSLGVMAQTNQPLPAGSVPLTATTYLYPADSTVWLYNEFDNLAIKVGTWQKVDSLFRLGWTPAQVDSAITANLSDYIPISQKGSPNGVATIDGSGKVPLTQIPEALLGAVNYQGSYNAATNTPALPSSPGSDTKGHYYVVSTAGTQFGNNYSEGDWIISNGIEWQKVDNNNAVTSVNGKVGSVVLTPTDVGALQSGDNVSELVNDAGYITIGDVPSAPVTSVQGETGAVMLDAADLGLGNVDNTSDANKPISTATQAALNGKENAFTKGSLVAGTNVTLSGTLTGRLVGSGDVTINASIPGSFVTTNTTQTGLSGDKTWTGSHTFNSSITYARTGTTSGTIVIDKSGSGTPFRFTVNNTGSGGGNLQFNGATSYDFSANINAPNLTSFSRTDPGFVPAPGGSGTTRYLREDGSWVVPDGGGGGGTATDLSLGTRTTTSMVINSSTGTNVTLPQATTSLAGLLNAADKTKLNGLTGDYVTTNTSQTGLSGDKTWTGSHIFTTGITYNRTDGTGGTLIIDKSGSGTPFRISVNNTGLGGGNLQFNGATSYDFSNIITTPSHGSSSDWYNPAWSRLTGVPSTFAPSAHTHNASDINSGTLAIARIPTGTSGSTVALGNHTHTFSAITSKPTTLSGYGITDGTPEGRTLTINGVSYNLSTDRSWTLGASDVGAPPTTRTLQISGSNGVSVDISTPRSLGNDRAWVISVDNTVARRNAANSFTGTNSFTQPVVVPNGTASNHAVNLSQITGSGSLILGTEPNKVKTNYQNDTTYMRFKNVIKTTTSITTPGPFNNGSTFNRTVTVIGAEVGDAVIVNAGWLVPGAVVSSYVSSNDTVTINVTNAGPTHSVATTNTVYVTVITNRPE